MQVLVQQNLWSLNNFSVGHMCTFQAITGTMFTANSKVLNFFIQY